MIAVSSKLVKQETCIEVTISSCLYFVRQRSAHSAYSSAASDVCFHLPCSPSSLLCSICSSIPSLSRLLFHSIVAASYRSTTACLILMTRDGNAEPPQPSQN